MAESSTHGNLLGKKRGGGGWREPSCQTGGGYSIYSQYSFPATGGRR